MKKAYAYTEYCFSALEDQMETRYVLNLNPLYPFRSNREADLGLDEATIYSVKGQIVEQDIRKFLAILSICKDKGIMVDSRRLPYSVESIEEAVEDMEMILPAGDLRPGVELIAAYFIVRLPFIPSQNADCRDLFLRRLLGKTGITV